MRVAKRGGGWRSLLYSWRMARQAGGVLPFFRALRSRNACKTCALGMGGQRGGMVNERGHFPEVCKKSMQAMAADMRGRIEPRFFERYGFDELRQLSPRELEAAGRLTEPLLASPGERGYRPISWDEALSRAESRLRETPPNQCFFYFSGRASNEAAFLWQLFARLYGTNHVNNCSYYCHQASGVGLRSALGSGTATIVLDDIAQCDLVFLFGANPASNHPRLMTMLADLRKRGGHVVVINPIREPGLIDFAIPSRPLSLLFGSRIASLYVQPHVGGDLALLAAIAKRVLERDAAAGGDVCEPRFIAEHTEGFDAWRASIAALDWESLVTASGVDRETIDRAAELYARSKATVFAWTMGITHHLHGVDNVRAIANLALLRGMVGRPHAGLLPIRGHSNVQGVGSMGVTPQLAEPMLQALQTRFGLRLPRTAGFDTMACVEAMQRGELRSAWCLGGNLFGSNPDAARTGAAFARLESVVYLSTTLNTGHAWGRARETLILPVTPRDEESQPTTQESMFNFVRMSDGGLLRWPGPRSEVAIVAELGRRFFAHSGPIDWARMVDHRNIREMIAAVIPGYEAIGQIDRTREEFVVAGRTLHVPRFHTPSGKARFHALSLPPATEKDCLRLTTIRSEGQFNTVVYEDEDLYRGQERRDVVLMSPVDIARLGLQIDQRVLVRSASGEMAVLVRALPIRPGNVAMYYPEANVLVPRAADSESRTPAFKNVPVTIECIAAAAAAPRTRPLVTLGAPT